MRILILNYEYPPLGGGAGNATFYLLKEFSKIPDLYIDLVTSSADKKYHLEKLDERINIHKLPISDKSENLHFQTEKDLLIYSWKAYFYARKLVRKNHYDLSHSFFGVPCGFISWRFFKKHKIPYVISLRGADVPRYAERFVFVYRVLTPLIKKIWKDASEVIANSQGLKDLALKSNPKQKINIICNGVDTQEFKPDDFSKEKDKIVITPGASRITSRKGLKYLIEAIATLSKKYPNILLEIIGSGDEKDKLEELAFNLGITNKVNFVGAVSHKDTLKYYQKANIFVLPSLNEGMSNTMLEALACGLPIISTKTGGSGELVQENQNGCYIKMKDSLDIVEKIEKIINNPELMEKMSKKSIEIAQSLSWKKVAEQYLGFYKRIAEEKKTNEKNKKLFLKFLVAVGFIGWLLYRINWKEVLFYFKQMDIWWMFCFVFIYAIGIGISSYKWKILANFKGFSIKLRELFKIYLTGAFINNFFPSIIGGDAYRSYMLGKTGKGRYMEATSTVLIDRITGFAGVMLLILVSSLFNLKAVFGNKILLITNALIIAFFVGNFLIAILRKMIIWNYVKKILPEKITKMIQEILSYQKHEILFKSLFWGAFFNFLGVGLGTWMLFLDLHIPISFANFMIAISIISIVSSIPVSIGNIGIKEWAFITFFGIFGVNGEAAISIAIFGRFLQMLVSFFAIPFYLKEKKDRDKII